MKIRDKVLPVLRPVADQSDIDDISETLKVAGVSWTESRKIGERICKKNWL